MGLIADPSSQDLGPLGTGECNDDYTSIGGKRWATRMDWYFYSASKPKYLDLTEVVSDLRAAVTNITHANNNCGRADYISATASYQGVTTAVANIGSNGTCAPNGWDGLNVVDFGALPSNIIAATCNRDTGSERIESDIRWNKACFTWTTGTCGTGYYVEPLTSGVTVGT